MILLIDGYNLIKQVSKSNSISEETRSRFINELAQYSRKKNHKVIIIFDGGDFSFPTSEFVNEVQVIYSGYKNSADTVIKDYLSENNAKDILLVSSDRELRDCASKLNIDSIKALDFYDFVKQSKIEVAPRKIDVDSVIYKTSSEFNKDLDQLMLEASQQINFKEDDFKVQDTLYKNKPDKHQQKISKKLKKL